LLVPTRSEIDSPPAVPRARTEIVALCAFASVTKPVRNSAMSAKAPLAMTLVIVPADLR
jgi:hypothetical protein